MAKTNMIERDKRRVLVAKKYAAVRVSLKEKIRSPKTTRGGPRGRAGEAAVAAA